MLEQRAHVRGLCPRPWSRTDAVGGRLGLLKSRLVRVEGRCLRPKTLGLQLLYPDCFCPQDVLASRSGVDGKSTGAQELSDCAEKC